MLIVEDGDECYVHLLPVIFLLFLHQYEFAIHILYFHFYFHHAFLMVIVIHKLLYQGIGLSTIVFPIATIPLYSHQLPFGLIFLPLGVVATGNRYIPVTIRYFKEGFCKYFIIFFKKFQIQVIYLFLIALAREEDSIFVLMKPRGRW